MTREDLIESLTELKGFTAIPPEVYGKVGMKQPKWVNGQYNAGEDTRLGDLLKYMSANDVYDAFLERAAFAIVVNISRYSMQVPKVQQMREMLMISGYSGAEMDAYIYADESPSQMSVASRRLIPSIYLLSRVLADALKDRGGWRGFNKGKKKKTAKPVFNPSMEKLRALVEYMRQNDLLNLNEHEDLEEYEWYVKGHAKFICMMRIPSSELESLDNAIIAVHEKAAADFLQEAKRLTSGKKNAKNSVSAMKLPLAKPTSPPNFNQLNFSSLGGKVGSGSFQHAPTGPYYDLMAEIRQLIPSEMVSQFSELEQFDLEMDSVYDMCWDRSNTLRKRRLAFQKEVLLGDYMPSICSGALLAILEGDDLYKLKIGQALFEEMVGQSDLPLSHCVGYPTLEDEGEWDYRYPEFNGRNALPVVTEDDLVKIALDDEGTSYYYVPLTAMISGLGNRPFSAPLYIRKSIVKFFKSVGFSDRKARDYAIVIATLRNVTDLSLADYRVIENYPDEPPAPEAEKEEEGIDERVAAAVASQQKAERDLKAAQKESQEQRHQINMLRREIEKLRRQMAEQSSEAEEADEVEAEDAEAEEGIEFPYHTDLKVAIYGGFASFHKEVEKLIPGVRVVEATAHPDFTPLRNADIVFMQTNKTDHAGYWAACDACKASGVPYYHLNYAGPKRCAMEMVREIMKLEK